MNTQKAHHGIPIVTVIVALLVAGAPQFFFSTPLFLRSEGNLNGFYGIAIWPAAVLAGFAFMYGVDFQKRVILPLTSNLNLQTLLGLTSIGTLIVAYSYLLVGNYPVITKTHPDFLALGLLMFMGLRGLEAIFVHGILQGEIFANYNRLARILMTVFAVAVVYAGFLTHDIDSTTLPYVGTILLESLLGVLLFEFGLPLYNVLIMRIVGGAIFIWFMQLFLF